MKKPFFKLTVLWLILMLVTLLYSYQHTKVKLEQQAQFELTRFAAKLNIELDKYRSIPGVIALHPLLKNAVQGKQYRSAANELLLQINEKLNSDVIYLMDHNGTTLAASNWLKDTSFVGSNYAFRPYFQQAVAGETGSYFALGNRSNKRGYFFSYPVLENDIIIGVVAVKVSLRVIEQGWRNPIDLYLLTDQQGVVFYSSKPGLRYHSLTQLSEQQRNRLITSRQYGKHPLTPLSLLPSLATLIKQKEISLLSENYLVTKINMPDAGWLLWSLIKPAQMVKPIASSLMLISLVYLVFSLIWLYWQTITLAKSRLAKMNQDLELRVTDRTKVLKASNHQLKLTLDKYQQTVITLEQTESELIQAAKLATLGEMSASINHELNQPLAAIRTYSENAIRLLEKNRLDSTRENLGEIVNLSKKMGQIIAQFKVFSRKSQGRNSPTPLLDTIKAAISLLQSNMLKQGVIIQLENINSETLVLADPITLEQVLINLLSNALNAVEQTNTPQIVVSARETPQYLILQVWDNGQGISAADSERLFVPFFTTKEKGLGLGLAISRRIVRSFGGELTLLQGDPGATFQIKLSQFQENDDE